MPAFDLDRSDRIIIEAEQRLTRHALRIAGMEARREDTATAVLVLRVYADTLAQLNVIRKNIARA